MGNHASHELDYFRKKHGEPAMDYIVYKYNQRLAYQQTRDELQRIIEHANLQERQDIEWCHQEKRMLVQAFEDFKTTAELNKPGSIKETEARHNKTIDQISGFDDEYKKIEAIQRQVRAGYRAEKQKIKGKVDQQIMNGTTNLSTFTSLPEFDKKSDSQRKAIEEQCLKQYPAKRSKVNTVDIERSLRWDNHKAGFDAILNRTKLQRETAEGRNRVKGIVSKPAAQNSPGVDNANVHQTPSSFCC